MVCTNNVYHIIDRTDQFAVTSYYGDTMLWKPEQYFILLTMNKTRKKTHCDIQLPDMLNCFLQVFSVYVYIHAMHLFSTSAR